MEAVQATEAEERVPRAMSAAVVLLVLAGSLVIYKASAAMATLAKVSRTGTMLPKSEWIPSAPFAAWARPAIVAINYFSWVLVALTFGVLIGAAVAALVPQRWLARTLGGGGAGAAVLAAALGAPLMLCSCCAVPVFDGVFQRTRRLGPALALLVAAPALNPIALVLTFLLFPRGIALARLFLSLLLVLGAGSLAARVSPPPAQDDACALPPAQSWRTLGRDALGALRRVASRSLPAVVLGALLSAALLELDPVRAAVGSTAGPVAALVVAAVALPIALPTFGEIPLALALAASGAPSGAIVALLVAGPAINMPSLFGIKRSVSTRAALFAGIAVLVVAGGGGALAGMLLGH
jgi:uncharacterized protein